MTAFEKIMNSRLLPDRHTCSQCGQVILCSLGTNPDDCQECGVILCSRCGVRREGTMPKNSAPEVHIYCDECWLEVGG